MIQRFWILILTSISIMTSSYCQGNFFHDMSNNMSWRDTMECAKILDQTQSSDYAFITQQDFVLYGKKGNTYDKISKLYYIVTLDMNLMKATRYKTEKIIQLKHKRFKEDNTSSKRFITTEERWDYEETVDFFQYIDSLGFHELDNDSLRNQCGLPDSLGVKECTQITDISDEIIYIKNRTNYRSVKSLYPEGYIEYYPDNNRQRRIFILCRNRFIELITE